MSYQPNTTIVPFPENRIGMVEAFLRGLPSNPTRRVYRHTLRCMDGYMGNRPLVSATRRDIEGYRSHLEELGRAPSTIAKHLAALSGFFAFAEDEGVIDRNPAARARRPKVPDVSPRQGLSSDEVRALLSVPDPGTLVGLRDLALVRVLAIQGWRISEALGLRVEHLGDEQGHKTATIKGKGGKVARVPLAAAVWTAITSWTSAAEITVGPVFAGVKKGGEVIPGRAISSQSAWKRIRFLAGKAGIDRDIHPHLFRHGCVTTALAAGVPLHQVQDFARHSDPRTTRRYDSHRNSLANPTPHVLAAALDVEDAEEPAAEVLDSEDWAEVRLSNVRQNQL